MATMVQMFNDLVTFSVLKTRTQLLLRMMMVTSKWTLHHSFLSANHELDNIASKFTALQSTAKQNIQTAEQQQAQLNQMAQQLHGGALSAALQNEGAMQKVVAV